MSGHRIEDVINHYSIQVDLGLSEVDQMVLVENLKSLPEENSIKTRKADTGK
jgi:hypothetical protein